jgi:hypothetical protein
MAREQASINAAQHYGPRETNTGLDNQVSTYGLTRQRELYFDFEQANAGLPTANAEDDAGTLTIPAGSLVKSCYLEVSTAFTSGGSATLQLGVQGTDGSTVDADGLDTIAVAALTAGSWTVCDGALVGTTVGTADVQISIDDAVAVFTAGVGRLVVEYVEPTAA